MEVFIAIKYIHENNLAHSKIALENIFIDKEGNAKINAYRRTEPHDIDKDIVELGKLIWKLCSHRVNL